MVSLPTRRQGLSHPGRFPLALLVVTLGGCAAPITQQGAVSRATLRDEQLKQQQLVLENDWKAQAKLEGVALPLLKAAVPMCGDRITVRSGVHFANLQAVKKEWQPAAAAAGLTDTVSIVSVVPGSAADRAGVQRGDRILDLNGTAIPSGDQGVKVAQRTMSALQSGVHVQGFATSRGAVSSPDSLTLSGDLNLPVKLKRGETVSTMTIPMDTVCNYSVVVQKDDALNAFADGNAIYVTSAMMRFVSEPGEIETVVAHEIAHNAMRHIDAKKRNAAMAGIFGALLDVAAATQGVNTGGEYTKQMSALGAMTFSQDFEREADYVGLYIMARANQPVTSSANLWRRMATESPGSIKFASSHPTTVERYVRLEAAAAEIEQKRASGQPLVPETKGKAK